MLILRSTYNAEKLATSKRIEQLELENQAWAEYADHLESKIAQLELTIKALDPRRTSKFETYNTPSIPHSIEGIADNNVMALSLPGMPNGSHKVVMDSDGHMIAVIDNEPTQVEDTPKPIENKPTAVKTNTQPKLSKSDKKQRAKIADQAAIVSEVESKLGRKVTPTEHTRITDKLVEWSGKESTKNQRDQWAGWLARIFKASK